MSEPTPPPGWPAPSPGELAEPYDAFISYRSASSRVQADQVSRALFSLSKRHLKGRRLRVFLDVNALTAGTLDHNITQALDRSTTLVVCLDPTTVESPWVSREIEYWLSHGGQPSRLFLVRTDPGLDLSWDPARGTFAQADRLPAPLRTVFAAEQKYFDVAAARRVEPSSLRGLYAAVLGIDPDTLELEEARFQRRRRAITSAVIAGLSVLLVLAIIASVIAVQQSRRSTASARTAAGEAAAAEALLTLPYSAPDAINQVLNASRMSESLSIRSALIAVASSTGALRRTVDWSTLGTGHRANAMAFSADGERLLGWGPAATPGRTHLAAWSVISGELLVDTEVEVADAAGLIEVGAVGYLACSATGPVLIDRRSYAVRELPSGDLPRDSLWCRTRTFAGGGLIEVSSGDLGVHTDYVSYAGRISSYPGAWIGRVNPYGWSAVLQSTGGVVLVSAHGEQAVRLADVEQIRLVTEQGTVLVQTADSWLRLQHRSDGTVQTERLRVPADTTSVSLLTTFEGSKHRYAWVSARGVVGWSETTDELELIGADEPTGIGTPAVAPELLPMGHDALLAVVGPVAYRLTPPSDVGPWTSRPLLSGLTRPEESAGSLLTGYCDSGEAVGFARGQWLIGRYEAPRVVTTTSADAYLDGCTVVDPGPPLAVDGITINEGALDGAIVVAPRDSGGGIAVVRPDAVTQLLNTGGHVEHTWRVFDAGGTAAARGERMVISTDHRTISRTTSGVETVLGDRSGTLRAVGPDGLSAVLSEIVEGTTSSWFVQDGRSVPACPDEQVRYLPGPDFANNVADAERAAPVTATGDGWRHCTVGLTYAFPEQVGIDDYQIGVDRGQIVWSEQQGDIIMRHLTTWTPGRQDTLRTRDLPALDASADGAVGVAVDATTDRLLLSDSGSGVVRSWRWSDETWQAGPVFQGSIGGVSATAWNADATLAFSFNATGGFELFDASTGRRLITDPEALRLSDDRPVQVTVTESDGFSYAHVRTEKSGETAESVEVAVRVDRLRELLCVVHQAPACDG